MPTGLFGLELWQSAIISGVLTAVVVILVTRSIELFGGVIGGFFLLLSFFFLCQAHGRVASKTFQSYSMPGVMDILSLRGHVLHADDHSCDWRWVLYCT